ncbi:hypothetical protein BGZ67_007037 [Mortierella alpina]|nr:hypothetical protein BGZ67_007037 [Mortierella alpina]
MATASATISLIGLGTNGSVLRSIQYPTAKPAPVMIATRMTTQSEVPNIMIAVVFGMVGFLFLCGFVLSCGLDPIVTQPLSKVLQLALVSPGVSKEESQKRASVDQMADVRLQKRPVGGSSTPVVLVNNHVLGHNSDSDSGSKVVGGLSKRRSSRAMGYHENFRSTPLLSAAS